MELSIYFPHTELQGAFPANVKFLFYFLEIDTKFADWIKNRISHYNFIENQDYIIEIVYTKGRPRKEYYVTLDMAKELCMVENNEKGRQARRYFIECEKRLKNLEQEQMQKLAFRQSLGYKSQLKQQKQKYENEIKALKYDLEQSKNNFKDKLNCILAKNGLYAFDFKTFKNYALKLEKMLKDLKDDENKENKLLSRMQNDFLECLELYKSINI
ncbi:antA/AntB antirepressor family protein [Campylobacter coli]|uniref:antA/AntB antirepressor family protein n=1 Tax=Campylobacter coli TaxID=195 RepID=UPI00070B3C35|nr:antA/AntB antirepressor family protein [Campylobacter coli]EDO9757636.1 phage antirepressor Ant [Campylobacter jejuni]EDP7363290.1 phage antirepressor Ant [Campylobacter jejuni]EHD0283608.1 phage antirepressor Ant [Campylobacter coli]EHZ5097365.1 antA/AntB antirepressor family protein [Campylobacter coli]ELI3001559.1 antA/AntB antirepressor family protein [Campylobacter coli]